MKRALILIGALAGCSLRAPRTSASGAAAPCSTSSQCGRNVCFLGECRPSASNLSQVLVSVQPANDSPFAGKQVRIDLRQSALYDFGLEPPYAATGTIQQDAETSGTAPTPISGANITFTDRSALIPDRPEQIAAVSDASGTFTARVPQGSWDITVVPPAPLPPYRTRFDTSTPSLDLHLPSPLQKVGNVTLLDGGPLPAASVTAVDNVEGDPLSAPTVAQPDGGYTLLLPPALPSYLLQVGPAPVADGGTPAAPGPLVPIYDALPPPNAGPLQVPLPAEVTLSGRVVDLAGNPIPAVAVYALSAGSQGWTLSRSTSTLADGTFALTLLEGPYLVEAAPAPGDPYAVSRIETVTAPSSSPLTLTCPPRVLRAATVLTSDGRSAGPNFQVIAARTSDKLLTTRTAATTPTDANGTFHLVADPGLYRVEIVPPLSSGLPRKLVSIEIPQDASGLESKLPPISLSPPLSAVGTVTGRLSPGGADTKVTGATVSFFALDASGQHSVFLGSALTDQYGQFKTVLPDVQNPGP